MLFPRMYSDKSEHISAYKEWTNFKGRPVQVRTSEGTKTVMKPTFAENLAFFLDYQLNYMYWRYFMWNFAGRQNDIQGHGEVQTEIGSVDSILSTSILRETRPICPTI